MTPTAEGREEGRIPHHQRCSRMKKDGSISMDKRKNLTNISRIRENKIIMAKPWLNQVHFPSKLQLFSRATKQRAAKQPHNQSQSTTII